MGIGAAGAGVDGKDGRAVVVRAGEGKFHFRAGQRRSQVAGLGGQLGGQAVVAVGNGQVGKFQQVGGLGLQATPEGYGLAELAQLLHFALGVGGVAPEVGGGGGGFQAVGGGCFAGEVKAAPRRRRGGRQVRRVGGGFRPLAGVASIVVSIAT